MEIVNVQRVKPMELYPKIESRVLFNSDRIIFVRVEIPPGGAVPRHKHTQEQMGILLSGQAEFDSPKGKRKIKAGAAYWIPVGEEHSVKVLGDKPGVFLDIFSPPRSEYAEKLRAAASVSRKNS